MYNLVCAFEVVEHFANPKREMAHIFERSRLDRYYRNGNLPGAGCRLVGFSRGWRPARLFLYTKRDGVACGNSWLSLQADGGTLTDFLSVHLHGLRALYCRRSFHLA